MLRDFAAAAAGFLVVGFGSVLIAGELWPSMRYEDALPGLLVAAFAGAAAGVWLMRILARRRR